MSLFDFQAREVVRVKVKLCDSSDNATYKKFSIDPGITTFEVLQRLLARAFEIKCDFTISYLATDDLGEQVYLSLLSDWDLDAAILSASDPLLRLKITLKNFDNGLDKDWDIISRGELPLKSQAARHKPSLFGSDSRLSSAAASAASPAPVGPNGHQPTSSGPGQFLSQLGNQMSRSVLTSVMQKAVGGLRFLPELGLPGASGPPPPRPPVSDAEFKAHLDSAGRVRDMWALKRAVYQGGLEPSLRKVAWRLLLPVFPKDSTGHERMSFMKQSAQRYAQMRDSWKQVYAAGKMTQSQLALITAISKDVIRTDRGHPFYAGNSAAGASGGAIAEGDSDFSPHTLQLFDLLVTYAIHHPSVGYAQGMSDLASPLLVVQSDEAYAYVCFCALMCRTKANFKRESTAMLTKFQHLHDLVVHMDAELATFLRCHGLADMFFTHRWLLLELKREFEFGDTLRMLEIQWAALPHQFSFPLSRDGVPLAEPGVVLDPAAGVLSATQPTSPKDTPYLRLQTLLRQSRDSESAGASASVVLLKDGVVELPPPEELGCGNPFLLFMCASILQLHRERLMQSCHDMCEIVTHFNRLTRGHNLNAILHSARQTYDEYVEAQDDRISVALTASNSGSH